MVGQWVNETVVHTTVSLSNSNFNILEKYVSYILLILFPIWNIINMVTSIYLIHPLLKYITVILAGLFICGWCIVIPVNDNNIGVFYYMLTSIIGLLISIMCMLPFAIICEIMKVGIIKLNGNSVYNYLTPVLGKSSTYTINDYYDGDILYGFIDFCSAGYTAETRDKSIINSINCRKDICIVD